MTSPLPRETIITIALSVALIGVIASVVTGASRGFDAALLQAFQSDVGPVGPEWLPGAVRDITALGSTMVLSLVVSAAAAYIYVTTGWRPSLALIGSASSALLLANAIKWCVTRQRPDLVSHQVDVFSSSFPSTHTMVSTAVYVTLGVVIARDRASARATNVLMGFAVLTAGLVGISRVYLGVHWPTDVLAGWSIGAIWAVWSAKFIEHAASRAALEANAQ